MDAKLGEGEGVRGGGRGRGSLRAIGSILLYLLSATFPSASLSLSVSRPRHLIRQCEHSQSQDVYLWQFNSKLHSRGAHASFSARHLKVQRETKVWWR